MELSSDASVIKEAMAFVNRRLQTPTKQEEDQAVEELQNQEEEPEAEEPEAEEEASVSEEETS